MTPIYKIFIFSVFVVLSLNSYGQKKDTVIKEIRLWYKNINDDSSLKVIKLETGEITEENSDGGIELTGYFKDKELVKIHLWVGLSYGIRQFEYYFNKGNLFFVYEKEEDFGHKDDGSTTDKLTLGFEGRFYIDQNKFIDRKTKGRRLFDVPDFDINEILKDLASYKKLLNKRFEKM